MLVSIVYFLKLWALKNRSRNFAAVKVCLVASKQQIN